MSDRDESIFIDQLIASQRVGAWLDTLRDGQLSLAKKQPALLQLSVAVQQPQAGRTYVLEASLPCQPVPTPSSTPGTDWWGWLQARAAGAAGAVTQLLPKLGGGAACSSGWHRQTCAEPGAHRRR